MVYFVYLKSGCVDLFGRAEIDMTESESGLLLWEGPRRNTYRHGVCVGAKMKGEISQHKRPKRSIMMAPTVVANVDLGINRTSNLLTLINRICLEDSKYLY